jgi:hypothetical protein
LPFTKRILEFVLKKGKNGLLRIKEAKLLKASKISKLAVVGQ